MNFFIHLGVLDSKGKWPQHDDASQDKILEKPKLLKWKLVINI